ncbi:hypothetical protein Rsub_04361 [Raphidocelis subcapitata]|uniref:Uncharacterized protein n=1 Tax=Raphidocelis subcapitata TaxID=307507 RepID=A0A2V0NVH2_9CHLO|nr:hypothetical protein Rsub_04361 [Raphidocelis subcapitata]|eukprot:GBF91621.1 hypothetical protein Rsub_04361 [Raphidocelis subcapitata]
MRALQAQQRCAGPARSGRRAATLVPARGGARAARRSAPPARALGDGPQQQRDLLAQTCPVPREQQPIFQLQALQDFSLYITKTFGGFFLLMGLPVSCFTFDLAKEPAQCFLSAAAGSLFVVTVLVWRMYLGWDHVGARLQSATVEYEETGWYDGAVWVKSPEVLTRDRLAVAYQIRPAIARLKRALLGLGGEGARGRGNGGAGGAQSSAYLPPPPPPPAAAAASDARSYEERVGQFEPWALDEGAPRPQLADHMRGL